MKSVRADINPSLLVWARESIGMTVEEAAKKFEKSVKTETIRAWELGTLKPTVKQLRKAAVAYKRPFSAFYLPDPPQEPPPIHDYRRFPDAITEVVSAPLIVAIRRAHVRREVALELAESLEEEIPIFSFRASIQDPIDTVALKIRRILDVSLEEQLRWKDKLKALNRWRGAIENVGVLVFQAKQIPLESMRGFSISAERFPVIVINPKDAERARIFSLIHELAHLVLANGGLCVPRNTISEFSRRSDVETFCNRLAAEILVPTEALVEHAKVKAFLSDHVWTDDELSGIADTFTVSKEVILIRLLAIGKTTREICNRKLRKLKEDYKALPQKKKSAGYALPPTLCLAHNGVSFVRLVLDAYHQESISVGDVSDHLDVKVKWLQGVEETLVAASGRQGGHF